VYLFIYDTNIQNSMKQGDG